MSRQMYGLRRAVAGFRKRERECCDGTLTCKLRGCDAPSAGYVAVWSGAEPICAAHSKQAEELGYVVHRGTDV